MIPSSFEYLVPKSVKGVIQTLQQHGEEARLLAGGHSLLPLMKLRLAQPRVLIDLRKLAQLRRIRGKDGKIVVGALATYAQLESSRMIKGKCPLLAKTAAMIGDAQVRNRGTIGGSLAHADPAADLPAAMLALGAEMHLTGAEGERWLPADEFFTGALTTALTPAELLIDVRIPMSPKGTGTSYQKVKQKASGFAIVGVAVQLQLDGGRCLDIGAAVTGLSAVPFRARAVEEQLRGQRLDAALIKNAAAVVADGVDALDDLHASADFRAHLARVHMGKAIAEAMKT